MCILVILRDRVEGWPLVVGANRDEYRDRPWTPARVEDGILAPRDERAGGTWIGLNRHGVLVAVTNRPDETPDPSLPSRGLLCLELLGFEEVGPALACLETTLLAAPRNPFRALIASEREAHLVTHPGFDGRVQSVQEIPPGLHTVTNLRALDDLDHGGALDVLDDPDGATLDEMLAKLRSVLALHEDRGPGGRDTICKHEKDRGTLSSTIVALPARDRVPPVFLMAPGPPCEAAWGDHGGELGGREGRPT